MYFNLPIINKWIIKTDDFITSVQFIIKKTQGEDVLYSTDENSYGLDSEGSAPVRG
jgi:hypothetical protein